MEPGKGKTLIMKSSPYILGIDVGSVCIHTVLLDQKETIAHFSSCYHLGEVKKCLIQMLEDIDQNITPLKNINWVAKTQSSPDFVKAANSYDGQVSIIRAARFFHQSFDAVLHIGGENFSLSRFGKNQNYIGATHNTSCAAGTGSFLDQQARRLSLLGGAQELSECALSNTKKIPDIATRCAVFAKTDLIHAQQEGYDIHQICDGLCYGLAKNISNTLFKYKEIGNKILFCGGVASNPSVKKHLESITSHQFTVDNHSKYYTAAGAALCLLDELSKKDLLKKSPFSSIESFFINTEKKDSFSYPELELKLSTYPDFSCFASFVFEDVETDIYHDPSDLNISEGYLGMDVGSTSTKSILTDSNGIPVAGFYTKTASRPVQAVQKIFKAYDHFFNAYDLNIKISGCGTTGSGRRISGKIIGADIEPDEITAHATAACNLNPQVDTIIEIGGQDAKFTLLKDGIVTSSVMNTVCAAGTGSFIEEQALKLDCPLNEYSQRTEGVKSPVASDRCTVFMERDINHYLAQGYLKDEILASVLHSVRDNYLTKVANIAQIGNCILFQGATAKNKALVAAFEQKLGKPIHVSKYCHLTGALGVALLAREKGLNSSDFRGFDLWKQQIPIRQEVCDLCTNHCKITLADLGSQTVAYGFLCGRDYNTHKRVSKSNSHNLLKIRKQFIPRLPASEYKHKFTIGIPKALHLFEDAEIWAHFFALLGIKTKISTGVKNPVQLGKNIVGAEFCAPVVSMHGHVQYLTDKTDYIFLPLYFEDKQDNKAYRRHHCYYTQFTPSVVSCVPEINQDKILTPVIKYLYTNFHTKLELYKTLKKLSSDFIFSFFDISTAYDASFGLKKKYKKELKTVFKTGRSDNNKIDVVLLGRPYTVLTKKMNNNIPQIFEQLGVQTFFQDMIDFKDHNFSEIQPLLKEIHWKYAAKILKTAYYIASCDNVYPVYISSFKCAPDSFAIDYFKKIMEGFNKPYLVLELDEHDSSVGYETRVEAAVRAFENHKRAVKKSQKPNFNQLTPSFIPKIQDRTIIFPNWDSYTGCLLVSTLKNEGLKAILMEETEQTLKKSILTNTGQCIPLNAIAAGFIHTVEKHQIDSSKCALWLNPSEIACNIKMYPYHIKKIINQNGNGFEHSQVYKGELSLFDISLKASTNAYFAYMFGGLLRSIGCKIRPYEIYKGTTDRVLKNCLDILCTAFEKGESKETALKKAKQMLSAIEVRRENRPKVGIFGDLYVRDNDVMNQDLVRFIEDNGGEAITTPYYKYVKIIANSYFKKWFKEGKYISLISNKALFVAMQAMERKYYPYFEPFIATSELKVKQSYEDILYEYGMLPEHTGESMDNILKIHHIMNEHPDLKLLVQTNPAFCCPGLVTESMTRKLEEKIKVPIVSITYDVSGGNKNKVIVPFLKDSGRKPYSPHNLKVSV